MAHSLSTCAVRLDLSAFGMHSKWMGWLSCTYSRPRWPSDPNPWFSSHFRSCLGSLALVYASDNYIIFVHFQLSNPVHLRNSTVHSAWLDFFVTQILIYDKSDYLNCCLYLFSNSYTNRSSGSEPLRNTWRFLEWPKHKCSCVVHSSTFQCYTSAGILIHNLANAFYT